MPCSEAGCDKPAKSRGLCSADYHRRRASGSLPPLPCVVPDCKNEQWNKGPCRPHRDEFSAVGAKWCSGPTCKKPLKPKGEFAKNRSSPDGLQSRCRQCAKDYAIANRDTTKARQAEWHAQRRSDNPGFNHGIADDQYWKMLATQDGKCAICAQNFDRSSRATTACIDHDHTHCVGQSACSTCVRSLLCSGCNIMLGRAHDDPAILHRWRPTKKYPQWRITAAIRYLTYWHAEMARRGVRPPVIEDFWRDAFGAMGRLVRELA